MSSFILFILSINTYWTSNLLATMHTMLHVAVHLHSDNKCEHYPSINTVNDGSPCLKPFATMSAHLFCLWDCDTREWFSGRSEQEMISGGNSLSGPVNECKGNVCSLTACFVHSISPQFWEIWEMKTSLKTKS